MNLGTYSESSAEKLVEQTFFYSGKNILYDIEITFI